MNTNKCILLLVVLLHATIFTATAEDYERFPDRLSKTVVCLGIKDASNSWQPLGTGFLMYNYQGIKPVLVTNRHIFDTSVKLGVVESRKDIWAKVDLKPGVAAALGKADSTWAEFHLLLAQNDTVFWTNSPSIGVDIAVIDFPPTDRPHTILGNVSDIRAISRSNCTVFDSLCLGQDVIFIGFPLGLGAMGNPQPFVRSGMISSLDANERIFWLDAQIFGGSSGSPVFGIGTAHGDPPLTKGRNLMGIVAGFKPSPIRLGSLEMDISETTKNTIRFPMENAGLGIVFSVDLILETIEAHNERFGRVSKDSIGTSDPN